MLFSFAQRGAIKYSSLAKAFIRPIRSSLTKRMPFHEGACGCQQKKSAGLAGSDWTLPGATPEYHQDLPLRPEHIDISINLNFPKKTVVNSVVNHLVSTQEGARSIELDAVDFLDVKVSDVEGRPVTWRYDGEKIHVTWKDEVPRGEKRKVKVDYRVEDPLTGLMLSVPDEAYPKRTTFAATDHETERARYWLACVDTPSVRTTLEYTLTGPKQYFSSANGLLQKTSDNSDGTKTEVWRLDYPCPSYLACFIFGDYETVDDTTTAGIPIKYVGARGFTQANLKRSFKETPGMITWLSNKVGNPFPFPKYYQFIVPFIGGAMENISLVSWDDVFLTDEVYGKEFQLFTDIVNIHEMTHSYFGDAVVMRHFEHAWLKESWATYMEVEWLREHRGMDEYRYELHREAMMYFRECQSYMRPIVTREYDHSWSMFDMHLYPGGSCRLHQLRNIMGDRAFWEGVQLYVSRFSKKLAETDDFRKCLEETCGRNLVRYFDEWFYKKGYPKIKGSFDYNAERKEAKITLEQSQISKEVGVFTTIDFEVEIRDDSGTVRNVVVRPDAATGRGVAIIDNIGKPKTVRVDPEGKLLFSIDFNPGQDILDETMRLVDGGDIVSRIRSAEELIKVGTRGCIRKVVDAMKSEPFYGVRVEVARALAKAKTHDSIGALAQVLDGERSGQGLYLIAMAAGIRDERIREALRATIVRKETAYMARARALESLALQHNPEDLEFIKGYTSDTTFQNYVRAGALKAMGLTRDHRAFEWLGTRLAYGLEPENARNKLVEGYAECARWQEKRHRAAAVEKLRELLRDPQIRVRKAAAAGLVTLEATEAAGDVASMKSVIPKQDWPAIDRQVNALRSSSSDSKVAELTKTIEDLEKKVSSLQGDVQDLKAVNEK